MALQVAVNEDDQTYFVGSMRASDVVVTMGLDNLTYGVASQHWVIFGMRCWVERILRE